MIIGWKLILKRSTANSAGYDFYSPIDIDVKAGEKAGFYTGVKAYMPKDMVLLMVPRSSWGIQKGFRFDNTVGVIDADFVDNPTNEGHIYMAFTVDKDIQIKAGDKICQGIFVEFHTCDDDDATESRTGGIGSTSK